MPRLYSTTELSEPDIASIKRSVALRVIEKDLLEQRHIRQIRGLDNLYDLIVSEEGNNLGDDEYYNIYKVFNCAPTTPENALVITEIFQVFLTHHLSIAMIIQIKLKLAWMQSTARISGMLTTYVRNLIKNCIDYAEKRVLEELKYRAELAGLDPTLPTDWLYELLT